MWHGIPRGQPVLPRPSALYMSSRLSRVDHKEHRTWLEFKNRNEPQNTLKYAILYLHYGQYDKTFGTRTSPFAFNQESLIPQLCPFLAQASGLPLPLSKYLGIVLPQFSHLLTLLLYPLAIHPFLFRILP